MAALIKAMRALGQRKKSANERMPKNELQIFREIFAESGVGKQTCLPCVDWLFTSVLTVCLPVVYQCEYLAFTERKTSRLKNAF